MSGLSLKEYNLCESEVCAGTLLTMLNNCNFMKEIVDLEEWLCQSRQAYVPFIMLSSGR